MAAPPGGCVFRRPDVAGQPAAQGYPGCSRRSRRGDAAARVIAAARKTFDDDVPPEKAFGSVEGAAGRAGLIHCPTGARESPDSCRFAADPTGHGLAVSAAL